MRAYVVMGYEAVQGGYEGLGRSHGVIEMVIRTSSSRVVLPRGVGSRLLLF